MGCASSVRPLPDGYMLAVDPKSRPWAPSKPSAKYAPTRSSTKRRRSPNGMDRALPGAEKDRFELIRTIGRGVMGEVCLAKVDGVYVALKVVSKGYIAANGDERHVHNERLILGKLSHPFIVALLGTFQDAKSVYFVLEFVAGGELFRKTRARRRMSIESAKFYLCEILTALAYIHAAGFCYRDLKPENVLIDTDGHCRIVDFGTAREVPQKGVMYTGCGTPAYLSPEQLLLRGRGGYSRAVDWWAFGCVTFELLTGRGTPFYCVSDDSEHAIFLRVIRGKMISFPSAVPKIAKSAVRAILRPKLANRLTSADGIKQHPFFKRVDWHAVDSKMIKPPSDPLKLAPGDTSFFDDYNDLPALEDDTTDTSKCNFDGF